MPDHTAIEQGDAPAPELPVILDMPGRGADFLRAADLEPAERAALDRGVTVRRGQGYTLRVSAVPAVNSSSPGAGCSCPPGWRIGSTSRARPPKRSLHPHGGAGHRRCVR
ncbi:hypothetical protein AB0K71_29060 [Streptomyces syringium]|uniref:hypothetical protein n=1 Tax=Streptomyces syringium TaxID=76729 RepID=UPI0033A52B32